MPSKFSSKHSTEDAIALAKNLEMHYEIIPIQNSVDSIISLYPKVLMGRRLIRLKKIYNQEFEAIF